MIHKVVLHNYSLMDNHYTLAHLIFYSKDFYPCTKESILFREYDIELLSGFLEVEFSSDELDFLQKEQNRKKRR
ncbi:hypothetical protein MNB_SV-12-1985 [hydrothermal vent metagenome]|uniref:Uncharacterized protein n=1 Tax=hydrothermal vent metagenome TaxID=652676 RepID=A0A1W1C440_9ZZZZ